MSDKIEVDRADLETILSWISWAGNDGAVIARLRKLVEPPRCRWFIDGTSIRAYGPIHCVLLRGHTIPHQVESSRWSEP